MPVEIIVRPTLGSYNARAIGHKGTASRSEGARQAADALVFKLNLGAGKLQEQADTVLPKGRQRFFFVSNSEMTECQFHNNCGGWCETQRELEHNLCEHCLETHDEQLALPAEQHQGEPVVKYPNRLCHIDYTAHPYLCGCLKGDEEAQKIYDDHCRAGEVERWKASAEHFTGVSIKAVEDVTRLRAQLAERNALLTGAEKVIDQFMPNVGKCCGLDFALLNETLMGIRAALSASAEPSAPASFIACHVDESCGQSAPVERDERAEFEAFALDKGWLPHQLKQRPDGNYEDWGVNPEWQAWKARAALERTEHHG